MTAGHGQRGRRIEPQHKHAAVVTAHNQLLPTGRRLHVRGDGRARVELILREVLAQALVDEHRGRAFDHGVEEALGTA
jgi:hypothetical protein